MYVKGNPILSKMFAHCGLTLNEQGLFYSVPENPILTILITEDHEKIVEAMGFNYIEYEAAKEYEEFFALLYTNQFFRPSRFIEDPSKGKNKMLKELAEYVTKRNEHKGYTKRNVEDMFEPLKEFNFKEQFNRLHELKANADIIRTKFNGRIVLKNVEGYDQRKLEVGMVKFNHDYFKSPLERLEFIYTHSEKEIVDKYIKATV
jgi:hypothetical protein